MPTEAALNAAMQGGGLVTFACDGTIPITSTKLITSTTFLDAAGHSIILNGGSAVQLFSAASVGTPITFGLNNITLANGCNTQATTAYGGALNAAGVTLNVSNCTFTGNTVASSNGMSAGGAVYTYGSSFANSGVTFTNCKFIANTAAGGVNTADIPVTAAGGAISSSHVDLTLINCLFINNTARGGSAHGSTSFRVAASAEGGAVAAYNGHFSILDSAFLGNSASGGQSSDGSGDTGDGGAIGSDGNAAITRCTFLYNRAQGGNAVVSNQPGGGGYGGGLSISFYNMGLTNCTLVGNTAAGGSPGIAGSGGDAHGGSLYSAGLAILLNCTIASNSAVGSGASGKGYGGGLENDGNANYTITNSILAYNTTNYAGASGNGVLRDGGHNLCSDASCGFTSATSLSNTDPRLGAMVYTAGSVPTLSLLAGSPAIDAGDDAQAPPADARGAARSGTHSDIGAYERSTWQADASAVAPDGSTRLVWNRSDGLANLWSVNPSGHVVQSYKYGPFSGWTATALSAGPDYNAYVLWTNADGRANVWTVDTTQRATGQVVNSCHYGPFPGWTAIGLSAGADGMVRLLWRNVDGRADLWQINIFTGGVFSSFHYGPFADWTVAGMSAANTPAAWLLWKRNDGLCNLWKTDGGGNVVQSYQYGPFAGWDVTSVASGGDGNAHLVWNRMDGLQEIWRVNNGTGVVSASWDYGPFLDFACTGVSVGADNNPHLLWTRKDGLLDLWTLSNSGGGLLSSFHFGPF